MLKNKHSTYKKVCRYQQANEKLKGQKMQWTKEQDRQTYNCQKKSPHRKLKIDMIQQDDPQ